MFLDRSEANQRWQYRIEWTIGSLEEEGTVGLVHAEGWTNLPHPDGDGFYALEAIRWPRCPVEVFPCKLKPGPYHWIVSTSR